MKLTSSLFISILILLASDFAGANSCRLALKSSSVPHTESFRLKTRPDKPNKVDVLIEKGAKRPKAWILIVHGLMDSKNNLKSLRKGLLEQSYGVVSMDLQGHAKSLALGYEYKQADLEFEKNTEDLIVLLKALKKRYGIEQPDLLGHSYGGGLVSVLVSKPELRPMLGKNIFLVAPYIFRSDFYQMEKVLIAPGITVLDWFKMGMFPDNSRMIMKPVFKKYIEDYLDKTMPSLAIKESFSKDKKQRLLLARQDFITRQTETAMLTTEGLGFLDTRILAENFAKDLSYHVVFSNDDMVVPVELVGEFLDKLSEHKFEFTATELSDSGHHMPQREPQKLIELILSSRL